jgi:hypothetical protein
VTNSDDRQPEQPESGRPPANPWNQPPLTEHPTTDYPAAEYPTSQYPAAEHRTGEHPDGGGPAAEYPPGFPPPGGYLPSGGYPTNQPTADYPPAGYPSANQPTAGYSAPGYPPPGYSTQPYPMVGQPPVGQPARRSRLGWILGAAVAVLLLLVGGGAVAAYQVLNGGGTQPDQVVPANAVAFAKLDLNPSASQKVAAARFLHRIPKLGSGFVGSTDWRQAMFQALASDGSIPSDVNYDRDVKPWLGKRAAIAVLPTLKDGDPEVVLVFQSTDDAKARVGIARFGPDNGVSFYKGYAIVAETKQIADQAVSSAKAANLSGSAGYQADMRQLGSLGVASGWTDLGAVAKLASSAGSSSFIGPLHASGRLAFTVRMTSNSADLIGKFYGLSGLASIPAPDLGALPATSAIALGVALDSGAVDRWWKQYRDLVGQFAGFSDPSQPSVSPDDALNSLEQQFGVRLPADLKTLLGSGLSVSMEAHGLAGDGAPKFAVQTHTDGAAAARVMDNIRHAMENDGADFPVSYRATATGLLVASDPDYLATVNAGSSPKLSGLASFRDALPDRAGATDTAFVNLDAIAAELRAQGQNSDDLKTLEAFSAVGLTMKVEGGTATLRIRLIAH